LLQTTAKAVHPIRVIQISRFREKLCSDREIDRDSSAGLQTPRKASGACRGTIGTKLIMVGCRDKIDGRKCANAILCHACERKFPV
jgi:hypothetical protein